MYDNIILEIIEQVKGNIEADKLEVIANDWRIF